MLRRNSTRERGGRRGARSDSPDDATATSSDGPSTTRRALLAGSVGIAGAEVAGAQTDGNETDGNETGAQTDGNETGATGGESVTVELVDYAYEPGTTTPLSIEPGTTVQFVWVTDSHNINVDSTPDGAEWEGHEPVEDAPFEYEYTFDAEGTYEFHCDPHLNLGMEGTIEVGATGGGGGPTGPSVPGWALTAGILTMGALAIAVGLGYFFLKYGGYEEEQ
ncbi:plastocyanin/azurin family copper-binding protein [Natronoarchaeum rubrum]|uniref:plastocyanin/azurin family copper-binding protein n=1 Tax=Natronoarchaeum rubrum TaxID=755311 RepID=UPI0021119F6F|nr:plastocyanin/azurin family copper-binding protein [Natronoarchaeum rubrum]